eukprot:CAMPEP_0204489014 /NCGR_PEP_ID=MMETSP0471-20130131/71128_1 /ASSEMBLY_ACC=CAM_ASM_000602 /TAXON_ID=2969 /ORGANISM="Oxyrrhis marina" /LENGTH=33 /DNA_ID= /DNA_START= /DNA_END= /DNA_ORIENTATION=
MTFPKAGKSCRATGSSLPHSSSMDPGANVATSA